MDKPFTMSKVEVVKRVLNRWVDLPEPEKAAPEVCLIESGLFEHSRLSRARKIHTLSPAGIGNQFLRPNVKPGLTARFLNRVCQLPDPATGPLNENGTDHGPTFHDLLHTFGTRAYRKGARLPEVMEVMGAKSITTTEGYVQATENGKNRALEALLQKPGQATVTREKVRKS
jgi:integrase